MLSSFVEGNEYVVNINGVEYNQIMFNDKELNRFYLGNASLYYDKEDTGENFVVVFEEDASWLYLVGSHDEVIVLFIDEYEEEIHKLNHKYLYTPNWSQNDESAPDYIEGRTHYEEETLSQIYTVSIEAGNSNVSNDSDGINYINVDETRWVFDGVVCDDIKYTQIEIGYYDVKTYAGNGFTLVFRTALDGSTSSSVFEVVDTSTFHTLEIYEVESIVHPLDEKYLPESAATKTDLDSYEFITVADIDEICSAITATTE